MKKTEILIKQTRTKSGLQCQRWDSQSPRKHKFTDVANFPDANLEDAGSFCRCPESSPFCYPWCFTRDPDTRAEECDMDRLQQHGTGTEIRYQDPSALPWSKMATATAGKDVYTAISTLSHCVSRVWRRV